MKKIIVISVLILLGSVRVLFAKPNLGVVDGAHCLSFSQNQLINHIAEFKSAYHINSKSTVYSASFDLDGDGRNEYFYYVDEIGGAYCGNISMEVGSCPINIVGYTLKKTFYFLDDGTTYPGKGFIPSKHLSNSVCITVKSEEQNSAVLFRRWWEKHHANTVETYIWPHM